MNWIKNNWKTILIGFALGFILGTLGYIIIAVIIKC